MNGGDQAADRSRSAAFWIVGAAASIAWGLSKPGLNLQLIRGDNRRFHIEAEAVTAAPLSVVLQTIRDYDHFVEFIPMLVVSRRVSWQGRPALEQVGRARFLIFHVDAHAILEEKFDPAARTLEMHALEGDFSRFDSYWQFKPLSATETQLVLRSEVNLKRWLPRWLERRQVRKSVEESLRALIQEMERRAKSPHS
jgi:ribosome-associated toxin RatA of RatAB toxin-antitoxin module